MLEYLRRASMPTDLIGVIGEVRRRWRLKLALRGVVRVLAVLLAFFLVAATLMQWDRFSPVSIVLARLSLAVTVLAAVYWFLIRPLRQRVTDEQVALYLEEHEPSLQATLLSAVESSRTGNPSESAALVKRVIEQALEVCARLNASHRVEMRPLRRNAVGLGAVAVFAVLAVAVGPAFLRHALSAMLRVASVQAASPYRIEVTPGNATVPKGADQTVTAALIGFASEDVVLMVRRTPTGEFEPVPLVRNDDGKYEGAVFDVNAPTWYQVVADGVQSPIHTLQVVDVPYVQRLEIEYHFPAYTALEPQKIEDGGDIAVLRGTDVLLRIFPTMKTPGGRITLNEKESLELAPQGDGSLTASFKADRDGSYRVELKAPSGELVVASPQYTIDVLDDQAPSVSFNRPGRDTSVSSIEEVFVEAAAEDDFGIRNLELVYSVNGGPEKVVKLFSGTSRLPEVTGGHTFYLEELGVETGDSVSYYARAADNDSAGAKTASSNLYFLRIRPFKKDFKQAQSQGGGGGGGGGGAGQVEALSEQQRQIISATFNVQRDRKSLSAQKFKENSTVVSLSQSRLREQVEGLLTRMNSQLVERDPAFAKIAELLPQAVSAMKDAEGKLSAAAPDQALPPENKALQVLQKAEEEYETQISVSRQQGGGGGGGGGAMQQELAEIFEQELDQMANRYETANQASEQQNDREVDELLEKLKELARRQEQEAERQRRRALQGQGGGGGGSAQQRALAEQAEEAARRLERLAREEQRPELQEAARQAREAADAMRRAAAGGDANASAQAQAALERLRETEKRLQRSLTQRAERDIADARRDAEEIARMQQEIADQVRQLAPNQAARTQAARQINEKKDQLEAKLGKLESDLDEAARDASREERPASRKMAEAAGAIRDNRLRDAVRYSKALVSRGSNTQANAAEGDISRGIDEMRQRLDEAQAALGQGAPGDKREDAQRRAERLARAAESLQERTRERATRDQNGRQQGSDGQQASKGQQGQQGQQGQGQQGEGQQGQGQGEGQDGGQQAGNGGGQRGGDARDGGGRYAAGGYDRGGAWRGGSTWGGWWEGGRANLTPEDIRQLRGEARQYAQEAQDLRGVLRGENIDPRELDEIVNALRQLQDERVYQNVEELARLQAFVADSLKRFEFGLRRQLDANTGAIVLSGSDEVPESFRKLVEQYYRSLGQAPR
ncbi:MAG TPA: DUF4175 family protein [Vicinamibacterales bacterium]|nr:DUF4175 family protein [Vicinamibacterales bacterium]